MQIRMPGTQAPDAPSLPALRRRVSHLSLLCVLEVLLAIPAVWAGYLLGGKLQPQGAGQTEIWSWAAAGVLAALFLAALVLTLYARRSIQNTVRIRQELMERMTSVISQVNAPKES